MSKKEMYKNKLKELDMMSLEELGNIINSFGKKYKGKKIKDIYIENPSYVQWIKFLDNNYFIGNDYFFSIEYSKKALILYSELMDYLNNVGK